MREFDGFQDLMEEEEATQSGEDGHGDALHLPVLAPDGSTGENEKEHPKIL